ncbi:hypothetical protein WHR41_04768 [Cladosporium halotolerans]|uniref:UBC core domain-containing protein n=1 Tax=Cladosporium halotolerans TaxID=1052096 RepID=A0AB34KMR0_9PEZI
MGTLTPARVTRRIKQELAVLQHSPLDTCHAAPISDSDLHAWFAVVAAPQNTPYAGGTFNLSIHFPPTYPLQPLGATCTTPIFHPNVSPQGEVGLAELRPNQWSPVIRTVLVCLQAMLAGPDLGEECVLNEEAARLCVEDAEGFGERARRHMMEHATPSAAVNQALEDLSKR